VFLKTGDNSELNWASHVVGILDSALRTIVAGYRLDELLEPHEPGRDPHLKISQMLHKRLSAAACAFGARILEVRLGALETTLDEIKAERISNWETRWASRARQEEARGVAEGIRERGLARAYAQLEIILSLAREFQDSVDRGAALPADLIILRFMEALRQTWSQPGGVFASSQLIQTWQALQSDVMELVGHDDAPRESAEDDG
jgi:regulator of protease activity HflC (stomatin/prohibitin superfamily)